MKRNAKRKGWRKTIFFNEAPQKVKGNQIIEITDTRRILKNLQEDNRKLNPYNKLASPPKLIVLRKTKLNLETLKKALKDSKETKQYVPNLAEDHGKYIDTMKDHKEAIKISSQSLMQILYQTKGLQSW